MSTRTAMGITVETNPGSDRETQSSGHQGVEMAAPPSGTPASANGQRSNRRTLLQQTAPHTIRRHAIRAATRFFVLVAGDLLAFLSVRAVVRAMRDGVLLGPGLAGSLSGLFPQGFLGGWQFGVALFIGLLFAKAYQPGDRRRDARRLFLGVSLAAGLALWQTAWADGLAPVAIKFVATVVIMGSAIAAMRQLVDRAVQRFGAQVLPRERIVFVGDPSSSPTREIAARLQRVGRMEVVGWVSVGGVTPDPPTPSLATPSPAHLGAVSHLWDVLHQIDADTVVVCERLQGDPFDLLTEAVATAGLRLIAPSRYEGIGSLRPTPVWYYGTPFVELTVPALRGHHLLLKRLVDVVAAGIGIVLTSPLLLTIGALIKWDTSGPVFFGQERVGYGGRTFRMLKFRTMREGADSEKADLGALNQSGDGRLFKIPDDPRVTRVGAWLRRWSLDELPQLWNVLRGEMSLVGPRPFFESDLAEYFDHHFVRLGAKPGITGLWQVNGRSAVVDFEEVVRMDREYIERWSLWLDLKILMATIPAVLRRTGAY